MATANTRSRGARDARRAIGHRCSFIWMIVPLVMTLWFSFQHYNLLNPVNTGFVGLSNYTTSSPIRPSSRPSATR